MLTKLCDRCGEVCEPECINLNEKWWRIGLRMDYHPYPEEKIDLCSKCTHELYDWFRGKKGDVK